ncbi:MAG TPA: hypothetical protein VFE78_34805 [Gemmataceae bacterium]|jgi:hypothetical protein|nr:hypothetical protein [Gemmataceae bacterium]
MQASAWSNGGGTYGIRVGVTNRDEFFDKGWTEIEVEVEGRLYRFPLTDGFWNHCPEIRDSGAPVIREWLRHHQALNWPKGDPPQVELIPLGGHRFRLMS